MAESELDALHSQRSFRVEFHIGIEGTLRFPLKPELGEDVTHGCDSFLSPKRMSIKSSQTFLKKVKNFPEKA